LTSKQYFSVLGLEGNSFSLGVGFVPTVRVSCFDSIVVVLASALVQWSRLVSYCSSRRPRCIHPTTVLVLVFVLTLEDLGLGGLVSTSALKFPEMGSSNKKRK